MSSIETCVVIFIGALIFFLILLYLTNKRNKEIKKQLDELKVSIYQDMLELNRDQMKIYNDLEQYLILFKNICTSIEKALNK